MNNENKTELLPCPFCNSKARLVKIGNDHTKKRSVNIKCTNKSCRIERTTGAIRFGHDFCEKEIVKHWNTRYNVNEEVDNE